MSRLSLCAVLVVFAAALTAAQQPVFRGTGDVVRLFVTVTDRDGRLATTLGRAAFEVRDEGKPQPITVFDNSPQPIRLVVMLDVSGSMEGNLPLLHTATAELMPRLRADDGVRLGTFGRDVQISPVFTRNATELLGSLPRTIDPTAPTPLWRALDEAMSVFDNKERREGVPVDGDGNERRVILVLSDGGDSGPTDIRRRYVSQVEVIDRARAENVMIYAVGMRARGRRQAVQPGLAGLQAALTADLPDPGLARVAEETGGGYTEIRAGEDLGAEFARVANELHSQYLIGYGFPKRDGKVHDVEVKVLQRGFKARGRKSYVAPKS